MVASMSKLKGAASHHEAEVAELRADRELAMAYLKAALESLHDPNERAAGLLALRTVAEAYGGLGAVAAEAGTDVRLNTDADSGATKPESWDAFFALYTTTDVPEDFMTEADRNQGTYDQALRVDIEHDIKD